MDVETSVVVGVFGGDSDLEVGGDSGGGSGDVERVKFDVVEGETRRGGDGECDVKNKRE